MAAAGLQFSGDGNTTGLEASYMRLDIAAIMEKVSVLSAHSWPPHRTLPANAAFQMFQAQIVSCSIAAPYIIHICFTYRSN